MLSRSSSAERSCLRQSLLDMRSGLMCLHKALILAEQVTYERIYGPVASRSELLELVLNDSWFTWIHPFSLLLQRIDQLLEDDESELWPVEVKDYTVTVRNVPILFNNNGHARRASVSLRTASARSSVASSPRTSVGDLCSRPTRHRSCWR